MNKVYLNAKALNTLLYTYRLYRKIASTTDSVQRSCKQHCWAVVYNRGTAEENTYWVLEYIMLILWIHWSNINLCIKGNTKMWWRKVMPRWKYSANSCCKRMISCLKIYIQLWSYSLWCPERCQYLFHWFILLQPSCSQKSKSWLSLV